MHPGIVLVHADLYGLLRHDGAGVIGDERLRIRLRFKGEAEQQRTAVDRDRLMVPALKARIHGQIQHNDIAVVPLTGENQERRLSGFKGFPLDERRGPAGPGGNPQTERERDIPVHVERDAHIPGQRIIGLDRDAQLHILERVMDLTGRIPHGTNALIPCQHPLMHQETGQNGQNGAQRFRISEGIQGRVRL